jgi:hypothetical protein
VGGQQDSTTPGAESRSNSAPVAPATRERSPADARTSGHSVRGAFRHREGSLGRAPGWRARLIGRAAVFQTWASDDPPKGMRRRCNRRTRSGKLTVGGRTPRPDLAEAHFILGVVLEWQGDLAGALAERSLIPATRSTVRPALRGRSPALAGRGSTLCRRRLFCSTGACVAKANGQVRSPVPRQRIEPTNWTG